jgi:hypothetical protein
MDNVGIGEAVDRDFNPDAWHDRAVWGLLWHGGAGDDWTSEFEVRFDSILQVWRIDDSAPAHYRVAPAKLVFKDVTDLSMRLDNVVPESDFKAALVYPMINTVERVPVNAKGDAPYFGWRLVFDLDPKGEISFGASGFVETVLADSIELIDRWELSNDERTRLLAASATSETREREEPE